MMEVVRELPGLDHRHHAPGLPVAAAANHPDMLQVETSSSSTAAVSWPSLVTPQPPFSAP